MAKRIIVEGIDGGGKSTLIEYLRSQFHNLVLIRNDLGPKQYFDKWWMDELNREDGPFIHDRFLYSELVYGPVLRGKIEATAWILNGCLDHVRHEAFLIYVRPPIGVIRQHLSKFPQMEGVEKHLVPLLEAYDHLMETEKGIMGDRFYWYDWGWRDEPHGIEAAVERYLL